MFNLWLNFDLYWHRFGFCSVQKVFKIFVLFCSTFGFFSSVPTEQFFFCFDLLFTWLIFLFVLFFSSFLLCRMPDIWCIIHSKWWCLPFLQVVQQCLDRAIKYVRTRMYAFLLLVFLLFCNCLWLIYGFAVVVALDDWNTMFLDFSTLIIYFWPRFMHISQIY